jgi:hypothetical protein
LNANREFCSADSIFESAIFSRFPAAESQTVQRCVITISFPFVLKHGAEVFRISSPPFYSERGTATRFHWLAEGWRVQAPTLGSDPTDAPNPEGVEFDCPAVDRSKFKSGEGKTKIDSTLSGLSD